MKKNLVIVGICITAVILIVFILVFTIFSVLKKEQNKEFYTLGGDNIHSFTYVVGERRLSGISFSKSNSEETKRCSYRTDDGMEDGKKYTQYLVESEGFEKVVTEQGYIYYKKQSVDTAMTLTITVVVSNKGVSITIIKENEQAFADHLPQKHEEIAA